MNKKIALISPHHEPNYGTMLQAYALAKAIENLGFSAEYISYEKFVRRNRIEKILYYLMNPKIIVDRFIKKKDRMGILDNYSFFCTPEFQDTMNEFEEFYKKYIPHSSIIYNPKTINNINEYSKYIVGSDQTWSPNLYSPLSINFLDFVKDNSLKYSYAPSLGTTNVSKAFQKTLKEKLSGFNSLSCREKTNCNLIVGLIGQKVTHVLDPTLLLTTKQWDEVTKRVDMPKKYILCYILGEKKCISDFADILGQNKNIPVYYIAIRPIYLQKKNNLKGIGPSQLISLIKNATYVITDSFHGTIFSINYNRNFYSFDKREQKKLSNDNGRIMEVLRDFGLTDRYRSDDDIKLEEDIKYDVVNEILEKSRIKSINYLKQIII